MEDLTKDDLKLLLVWASNVDSCVLYEQPDHVSLHTRITERIEQLEELEAFQADCGDACKL